jgi:hypothetical protein
MFEFDFADVKPSVLNWLIIGIMAATFIALSKYVVNTYQNPVTNFFSPLFNSL